MPYSIGTISNKILDFKLIIWLFVYQDLQFENILNQINKALTSFGKIQLGL